jgi:plastocyanin
MRLLPFSAVLGILSIAVICERAAHSQDYYSDVVYYSSPRVVYYRSYAPMYYGPPVYYSDPVYYSYYEPQYLYYAPPEYCQPSSSYQSLRRSEYSTGRPAPAKPTTTVTVGAYDNRFEPKTINVELGTTVRWVNYGQHAHTITANDDSWDSGDIRPGAAYSATFKQPGTYHYYCRHHKADRMQGVIVVASGARGQNGGTASSGY